MLPLAKEYESSLTEIKALNNDLIVTGYIHRITPDYIELTNPNEPMFLIPYETRVKLNIFNSRLGFQILAGKVYLSTTEILRVVEVSSLGGFEKRTFFRLNIRQEAAIRLLNNDKKASQGKEQEAEQLPVQIENISLGGVSFSCDQVLKRENKLVLSLQLPSGTMSFQCEIRRIQLHSEPPHNYGCRFYDYNDKQIDILYKYIFQQQMEMIRKRKNMADAAL